MWKIPFYRNMYRVSHKSLYTYRTRQANSESLCIITNIFLTIYYLTKCARNGSNVLVDAGLTRKSMYVYVTLTRLRTIIIAVQKQTVLRIPSVCFAMCMRHIFIAVRPALRLFPHYLIKGTISGRVIEHKICDIYIYK
jgi:hypothetical protein